MKFWPSASLLQLLVFRVASWSVLLPTLSFAQVIWDNGGSPGNRWGTANSWSTNTVPISSDDVQINATDGDATVSDIQLRANQAANSLTFNAVDDNFNIVDGFGTNTLSLTSGDITRTAGSSGTQGLTFTTLALGGDAAMNIAGTGSLTISSAITGAFSVTKSGDGELILSGANTYSNSTTVSAGTLTLASSSALGTGGTLTLSGGTLKLSTASTTITNLNVTATSTIDFGSAFAATLNVTNFTINTGATLNIINWVSASDFFYTTNWLTGGAGAGVYDATGAAPMNQVVFASFNSADTRWRSFDNQITPIPEPSTYGAMLLTAVTGLAFWRRRSVRLSRIHAEGNRGLR